MVLLPGALLTAQGTLRRGRTGSIEGFERTPPDEVEADWLRQEALRDKASGARSGSVTPARAATGDPLREMSF